MLLQDSMPLSFKLLERSERADGRVRIRGKFQQCGVKNRNNRVYPKPVWERHLQPDADFMKAIRQNKVFGHLEHPDDGRSNLNLAAVKLESLTMNEDGSIDGEITTLSTEAGKKAAALFNDGLTIGVSSRGHGSVQRTSEGIDEVQEDFIPEAFDLVAEPSTPGADLVKEAFDRYVGFDKLMEGKIPDDARKRAESDNKKAIFEARLSALEESRKKKALPETAFHQCNDLLHELHRDFKDLSAKTFLKLEERIVSVKEFSRASTTEQGFPPNDNAMYRAEKGDGEDDDYDDDEEWPGSMRGEQDDEPDDDDDDEEPAPDAGETECGYAPEFEAMYGEEGDWGESVNEAALTRRVFVAVADILRVAVNTNMTAREVAKEFADYFASQNPRFDRGRFLRAAGVDEAVVREQASGSLSHTIDVFMDFGDLTPEQREKFDVFRPGESLDRMIGEVESGIPADEGLVSCEGDWAEGNTIHLSLKFKGNPKKVSSSLSEVLGKKVRVEHVDAPGSRSGHLPPAALALIQGLRDRLRSLQTENTGLLKKNANLRDLNDAMAELHRRETLERKQKEILEKHPELKAAITELDKARTVEELEEKARVFLGVQTRKPNFGDDEGKTGDDAPTPPKPPKKKESVTHQSGTVQEGVPRPNEIDDAGSTVTDGNASAGDLAEDEDTFSRYRRHRKTLRS